MTQHDYISPILRYPTSHSHCPAGDGLCGLDQESRLEKEQKEGKYPDNLCTKTKPPASGHVFSTNLAPRTIAMQLLHDSWIIFKELKLEDWANYVMGMPSVAIGLFESYHNQMGLSLYSLLQQSPCVVEVFREVTKVSGVAP
jgi:hypothetical protein